MKLSYLQLSSPVPAFDVLLSVIKQTFSNAWIGDQGFIYQFSSSSFVLRVRTFVSYRFVEVFEIVLKVQSVETRRLEHQTMQELNCQFSCLFSVSQFDSSLGLLLFCRGKSLLRQAVGLCAGDQAVSRSLPSVLLFISGATDQLRVLLSPAVEVC